MDNKVLSYLIVCKIGKACPYSRRIISKTIKHREMRHNLPKTYGRCGLMTGLGAKSPEFEDIYHNILFSTSQSSVIYND